jgi:hypothetical protein
MILPAFSVGGDIVKSAPQIRQWMESARNENFVSIGAVGEAVHVLPGILESIEVSDSLLIDNVDQEGQSGSIKVIHGWSDCDVSITLTLLDIPVIDTANARATPNISRYDCLAEIVGWFKKMKDGLPQVYTIRHPHIGAWGAREFVYSDLKSSDSRDKKIITCTLEFDEYDSTTGKSQDRQLGIKIMAEEGPAAETPPVADKTRRGLGELEQRYEKL